MINWWFGSRWFGFENWHVPWTSMVGRCISYGNSAFLGDMLFFRGVITSWIKPLPLQKSDLPHLPVSEPHLPPKHRRQVTRQEGKVWVKFTMKPWSFRKKKTAVCTVISEELIFSDIMVVVWFVGIFSWCSYGTGISTIYLPTFGLNSC